MVFLVTSKRANKKRSKAAPTYLEKLEGTRRHKEGKQEWPFKHWRKNPEKI